jgi:hypothetical protein
MTYPDDMSTKMVRFPGLRSLYLQVAQPVRDLGAPVLALLLAEQSGKLLPGLGKDAIAAFVPISSRLLVGVELAVAMNKRRSPWSAPDAEYPWAVSDAGDCSSRTLDEAAPGDEGCGGS